MKLAIWNGYAFLIIKYRIQYLSICFGVKKEIKIPDAHSFR